MWSWSSGDIPQPRVFTSYTPSACANGGFASSHAFACMHMAMFTDDMLAASRFDGLHDDFVYAVAGSTRDSECGKCYQIKPLMAEKVWRDDFPQLVVQVINSGFDVLSGQFDLFMGAGGQGYFTAVNSDCFWNHCSGGPCSEAMFAGNFSAWTDAEFPDPNRCYSGGIKWFEGNSSLLWDKCKKLSGPSQTLKDVMLWDSCVRSNLALFHQNFYETKYARVKCPEGLYRLTGLRRTDDDEEEREVHVSNDLPLTCKGGIAQGHACLTTMHDGCVPSCAWPGKVDADPQYSRVDRCDRDNAILPKT